MKAWIERGETVEVLSRDRRRVSFETLGTGGSNRVAKIVDEDLAISRLAISPRRHVVQRLVRSAYPAELVVPNCANPI